jgi:translation initiation factor IF-3
MDYGKYLYEQKKAEKKQKKGQKQTEVKGIRISLRIGDHDLQTKIKKAKGFFDSGNLVKFTLIFKGREHAHTDLGYQKFEQIIDELKEIATIDTAPKKQGSHLMMILAPK